MRKHALLVGRFLPSRPLFCLRIRLSLSTPRIHLCGAMLSTDAPDAKRRGSFERWKRTNQLSPCPTPRQLGEPTTSTRAHKQVVQNSNNQKKTLKKSLAIAKTRLPRMDTASNSIREGFHFLADPTTPKTESNYQPSSFHNYCFI